MRFYGIRKVIQVEFPSLN